MSLDISLHDSNGECIQSMNWLRNPFGLCSWAEDNAHHAWKRPPKQIDTLWYVTNHWRYDISSRVDRPRFKAVVDRYAETLLALDESCFFFALPAYRQFVQPHEVLFNRRQLFPGSWVIEGSFYDERDRLAIPVEQFGHSAFHLDTPTTASYQAWYRELVGFAVALQERTLRFDCSN